MTPATRICLARHGQTDWNATGILQGWCDVPLNDTGRAQSRHLAQTLAGEGFQAVWSSPLLRARQTATIIADQLNLSAPHIHDGLKERHFGVIQGQAKAMLAESHPGLLQHINQRNPAVEIAGGEHMDEFADRVQAALAQIAVQPGPVLVISHGWVLDVATRQMRGLPRHALLGHKPGNGEYLWLEKWEKSERVERLLWSEADAV